MGSGSSPASPKPPSKGRYICNADSTHQISWEVWHNQMLFPEGEWPGKCGINKCPGTFMWHPTGGIPPAEAVGFEPPDMEEFINGVGKTN